MTEQDIDAVQKRMKEQMTYIMMLGKGDPEAPMYIRDVNITTKMESLMALV